MADKELVAQTGLLTQIAESVRKTNEMTQQNIIADDTSQSIDELKDSISKDNQDQKNLNQETNRQTFVERLKDAVDEDGNVIGEMIEGEPMYRIYIPNRDDPRN